MIWFGAMTPLFLLVVPRRFHSSDIGLRQFEHVVVRKGLRLFRENLVQIIEWLQEMDVGNVAFVFTVDEHVQH